MKWKFRSRERIQEQDPDKIIEYLLNVRGISKIDTFLNPDIDSFNDPFKLKNVREGSRRIIKAIENREKISIYGDYDTDGVTATALLLIILRKLNADVDYYIPHRLKEGYGLNKNGIQKLRERGTELIVTVDCGINATSEIKLAKELGMDIIITDHHIPARENPADIVINPKLSKEYPYKELAGVGVAFKLCQGIQKISNFPQNFLFWNLDLVALGTVADVMPLTGENRVITLLGLKIMNERRRPGIKALLRNAEYKGRIKANHISFILAPRINALGRLKEAGENVELLTTYNEKEAERLAKILEDYNTERGKLQEQILKSALKILQSLDMKTNREGIVLSHPKWHEGVVGIVASKIAEKFYRPTILIAEKEDICKGSGRSIPEFDIMEALVEAEEFLEDFGGHPQACGISIKKENIKPFKEIFNRVVREKLKEKDLTRKITVDFPLSLHFINDELIKKISFLAPFGVGNPSPIFSTSNLEIVGSPKIVGKNHLKFMVRQDDKYFPSIGFSQGKKLEFLKREPRINIAYTPFIDDWSKNITLKIRDIKVEKPA